MIGKLGKEVKALKKILIVEDDQLLNRTLAYNLTSDGYEVISVFNFDSAVRKLRENEFDVALLDINLPDGSGLDLCEEIRNRGQHTYIIFITANDKESDMLKGYEVGGADYVTKPFSVTVLCKKVAAVFANLELRTPRHDLFDDGFLKIDFSEQSASLAGESLDFTPKEYRTLFLFVKNPRIILTKRQILEKLWDIDGDFVDEHTRPGRRSSAVSVKKSKQTSGNILRQLTAWAISGSAVSLDEAAKFICQGIFEKNCGGDSAHCRFAAVDFFPIDERCACCHLRHYFDSCILHLGHGFSALFSKETFSVHRWFVPDIGSHDGQYRLAPGRL